jgi:flagellar motor protein MotB
MTRSQRLRSAFVLLPATALAGCVVPQARYEEAQSSLSVEQAAHRQTAQRLQEAEQRIRAADQEIRLREQKLETQQEQLAQSQLDMSNVSKDRQDAVMLVEQLRGELARVGDHLRSFSDQKSELARELGEAEARLERLERIERGAVFRAEVVRDLSLAFHEALGVGEYELAVSEGRVVLRVPSTSVLEQSGAKLHSEADQILAPVASIIERRPGSQLSILETDGSEEQRSARTPRVARISGRLVELGIPEDRVTTEVLDQQHADLTAEAAALAAGDAAPELPATVHFAVALE